MEETKEMDVVEVAPEDIEVTDLPPVEESSGFSTLGSVVGLAAGAVAVAGVTVKVSQWACRKYHEKKGEGIPVREKKFQFWRPKAAKGEVIPMSQRASINEEFEKSED